MSHSSRRSFLKSTVGLAALPLLLGRCGSGKKRPNFVLIMADDLGYGDIGCYGNERIQTPNLDEMASLGLRFTDFHANAPVCTPTRAALLTGRYQQRSGLEGVIYVRGETRQTGLAPEEVTFADVLQQYGYRTGIFGKWHLGYQKQFNPVYQGFDQFRGYVSGNIDYISHYDNAGIFDWWHNSEQVEEEGYVTDLLTDHAIEFIRDNKDKPFCCYIAHEAPHWPYQSRDDKADRFPHVEFDSHGSRPDRRQAYKEMVEIMDENIGRVLQMLVDLELETDTFVFFCSDNGAVSMGNNGGLRGDKGSLWEGGHRVPALAYWPGKIQPGETSATMLSMDVMPTLLNLAGIPSRKTLVLDGIDMAAHILKREPVRERAVFWAYRGQKVARLGEWKLLVEEDRRYLFNLAEDVGEQNDLSAAQPERVSEMERLLTAWEADVYADVELKTT